MRRCQACWTARHHWTATSPRPKRRWPLCAVPATSSPSRCSTPTGGWLVCCLAKAQPRPVRRFPPTSTSATRWHSFMLISVMRTLPPSSAIRPAWSGTPRPRCHSFRLFPGLYPTAVARLLRGLALAGQARAADGGRARRPAGRTGRGDPVAGRTRRGRARQLPAPAAAARGRAGLGGRRLPRRRPGLRRRPARGRPAPAAVAPGPDRRTRRPVLPRPRPGTGRPRPARPGAPGVPGLGRDRQSRPAGLGLPGPAATGRRDRQRPAASPAIFPSDRAAVTAGTIDLLGILSGVAGAELGDQHRPAARPRGPGAQRDDRRHRRPPAAVERGPAWLAAARIGRRRRHRPGQRHRP